MRTDGVSNGFTIVVCCLNRPSAQIFNTTPKAITGTPKRTKGAGMILEIGNRKCRDKAADR
jgi:hypothetical protein